MHKEDNLSEEKLFSPTRVSGVSECAVLEELVLLSPDGTKAFSLNQTASAIWELCDGNYSLEEIHYALRQRFEDASDNIFQDLVAAIEELHNLGMLESCEAY